MKNCHDCGYLFDDFDVRCPRCSKFGAPQKVIPPSPQVPVLPSVPVTPYPVQPVQGPPPALGQEFMGRGSRAGGLLFLLPALACFFPALFLGMPGAGSLVENAVILPLFGFPIVLVGGSLGAYYVFDRDAFWADFAKGMVGGGAWIMFLRLAGIGRGAMDMNGPFLMAFVTSAVIFGVGCYVGSSRVQRGIDNGDVPFGKIIASVGSCCVPLLGFWLTWNYWQNDDEKAAPAAGGLAMNLWFGGLIMLVRIIDQMLLHGRHR